MVGHHQHREARAAEMGFEPIGQAVHLAFEARSDIMDRSKQQAPSPTPAAITLSHIRHRPIEWTRTGSLLFTSLRSAAGRSRNAPWPLANIELADNLAGRAADQGYIAGRAVGRHQGSAIGGEADP